MSPTPTACPTDDEILAWLSGFADDAAGHALEQHVLGCRACTAIVAQAARALVSGRPASLAAPDDIPAEPAPGDKLGRYVILEAIGRGAMALVYSAYDPELDRRVALKFLRPERDGPGAADSGARLLREAQAMARLAHPNVLPIHDVGAWQGGVFLTMDLAGGTLRAWLRSAPRSPRAIVAAFSEAGRGLAAAHKAGIVHRDFKPDNVVVADDGRMQVTDFGLARLGDALAGADGGAARTSPSPLLTGAGTVVGTPAFMAPEQLASGAVDARADQFSFCAALFEALHGVPAFDRTSLERLRDAVVHGRVAPTPKSAVPRWLDAVVRRGLSSRPADRYADMDALLAALAKDPRRHLRRALPLALAAGLAATIAWALGPSDPRRERLAACAAPDSARIWDPARAEAVARAFAEAAPMLGPSAATHLDEAIRAWLDDWLAARGEACASSDVREGELARELRLRCLDDRMADAGALIERFTHADGETVTRSVKAFRSLEPLARCADTVRLLEVAPMPDDGQGGAAIAAVRARVAALAALHETGAFVAGRDQADAVVAAAVALRWAPLEAEALLWQGRLRKGAGDLAGAAAPSWQAMMRATRGGRHDLAAQALIDGALLAGSASADKLEELLRLLELARVHVELAGDPPLLVGQLELARARVHVYAWKPAEAEADMRSALARYEAALGPDHPRVAAAATNLQFVLTYLSRHDEAIALGRRAVAIYRKAYGDMHPDIASALNQIAISLSIQGHTREAIEATQEALAIRTRALGPDSLAVGETLHTLGGLQAGVGDNVAALASFDKKLAIAERVRGPDHLDLLNTLLAAAPVAADAGVPERGDAFIARARALLDKNGVGPGEVRWALFHLNEAQLDERVGRWDEADAAYLAALRIYESNDALPGDQAQCRTGHARMLLRRGAAAEARAICEEALAVEEREFGATHPGLADALLPLAEALERTGDHAAAVAVAWRAVDGLAAHAGVDIEPLAVADAESLAAAVFVDDPALSLEADALMSDAPELASGRPRVWPWLDERLAAWPRGEVRSGW